MSKSRQLYGISSWLYEEKSLDEALHKIADAGFKCIEIWANIVHLDPRAGPDIKSIKMLVDRLDLQVHSIHAPFTGLNIGYPDIHLEKEWLRIIGTSLEYGIELGAEIAVIHTISYNEDPGKELHTKIMGVTKGFIEKLNERARQLGIRLALENQPHIHIPSFASSLKDLSKIWTSYEIGFCFDIGHASINGLDSDSEISAAGRRLISVHVNNNDGVNDLHWPPSTGVINWQDVKKQLNRIGYNGPYILEIRGGNDPDTVLNKLKKYAEHD